MTIHMSCEDLSVFLLAEFPQAALDFRIERVTDAGLVLRLRVDDRHLRPGGTVSGHSIFALADVAVYLAILTRIGPVKLEVTTSVRLDFMRKPAAGCDLLAVVRLLKLGRTLAVADALIVSEGGQTRSNGRR